MFVSGIGSLALAAVIALSAAVVVITVIRAIRTTRQMPEGPDGSVEVDLADLDREAVFGSLVTARLRFSQAVEDHERALASSRESVGGGSTGLAGVDATEQAKDRSREALIAAQNRWEEVRPGHGPSTPLPLWYGDGALVAWQLGPIGRERLYLRLMHAVDSSCWAAWSGYRWRFGFGLGVERVSIAAFSLGADMGQLPGLIRRGFGGPEVAVRPGFSLSRWLRLRSRNPEVRAAAASLMRDSEQHLTRAPSMESRQAAKAMFSLELGADVDEVTSLPPVTPQLSLPARGPSVLVGVWWGAQPNLTRVGSSGHTGWNNTQP